MEGFSVRVTIMSAKSFEKCLLIRMVRTILSVSEV